ncbi:MAG: hypothetical protein GY869_06980 [Planctomycetes bacterium]|nr:hypothetical protein [Planctomycetota bacterium]
MHAHLGHLVLVLVVHQGQRFAIYGQGSGDHAHVVRGVKGEGDRVARVQLHGGVRDCTSGGVSSTPAQTPGDTLISMGVSWTTD